MSRITTQVAAATSEVRAPVRGPAELAAEVATVLAGMTSEERVLACRGGDLSAHELAVAAARFPDRMPVRNDEFEWIAIDLG